MLANVAPGSDAVLQVRAWEAAKADTYEQSRALGGKFGKSEVLTVTATAAPQLPQCLIGLSSFNLRAGLPQFTVGVIKFVERLPENTIVWAVIGESGFRYLVEKANNDFVWQPYVVL